MTDCLQDEINDILRRMNDEQGDEWTDQTPEEDRVSGVGDTEPEAIETIHVFIVRESDLAGPPDDLIVDADDSYNLAAFEDEPLDTRILSQPELSEHEPSLDPRDSDPVARLTLGFGIVLVLACLVFQVVLAFFPPIITVVLLSKEQALTATATLPLVSTSVATLGHIRGRILTPLTLSQTAMADATETGHQDARQARGTITFYNGEFTPQTVPAGTILIGTDGVQIVIEQDAMIPAASPPNLGQVSVSAHAVDSGPQGNIAVGDIHQTCCVPSVLAANTMPFSGGQNARTFKIVTQADISGVAGTLKTALMQSMQAALQTHLGQEEALELLPCTPTIRPDHQVGQEAPQVQVTVSATCTGIAYHTDDLQASVTQLLSEQATKQLGSGYSVRGSVQAQINRVTVQQAHITLTVMGQGIWAYQLTTQVQQHIKTLVAGKTKQQAFHLLGHLPGLQGATIEGIENETKLPHNPSTIRLVIVIP